MRPSLSGPRERKHRGMNSGFRLPRHLSCALFWHLARVPLAGQPLFNQKNSSPQRLASGPGQLPTTLPCFPLLGLVSGVWSKALL